MANLPHIIPYPNEVVSRGAISAFLHQVWPDISRQRWEDRLRHWWDLNPFVRHEGHLGTAALMNGELVGFGGYIPARFAWQGNEVPGLYTTSFRVDPAHQAAAVKMFLSLRETMQDHVIVHSTALPRIQTALLRLGAKGETEVTCHYVVLGRLGRLHGRHRWPSLDRSVRLVTSLDEVTRIERPYQRADRLEKWTSLESLRWYLASPMRRHRFVGAVDAAGVLTSFLMLAERCRRGVSTWDVVEAFSTREDYDEVLALVGCLVRSPELLPGHKRLLTVTDFENEPAYAHMPALARRREKVCHYFLIPPAFRNVSKHTVLAEGDLGL